MVCGRYVSGVWRSCGWCVEGAWVACGSVWVVCGGHVGGVWKVCERCVSGVCLAFKVLQGSQAPVLPSWWLVGELKRPGSDSVGDVFQSPSHTLLERPVVLLSLLPEESVPCPRSHSEVSWGVSVSLYPIL